MGKKKSQIRVVLDTNILVSALLFNGELSRIVRLWKIGKIVPVISRETFEELKAVLSYPKFRLTEEEIKIIVEEEILPYFEVAEPIRKIKGTCRDPEDDKFIECALSGAAEFIVSGDKDLCDLGKYKKIPIIKGSDLLRMFES